VKDENGLKIRFCAGAPIVAPEGQILGSFCIIDFEPRAFTRSDENRLLNLASETAYNIIARTNAD